jgi:hypothetical protein
MNKKSGLKFINIVIAIMILSQIATGLSGELIGKEAFEVLHKGGAFILFTGVIIHVILNWGWVKSAFSSKG